MHGFIEDFFLGSQVATQEHLTICGAEPFFKSLHQFPYQSIVVINGLSGGTSASCQIDAHQSSTDGSALPTGPCHAAAKASCDARNEVGLDPLTFGDRRQHAFCSVVARVEQLSTSFCCLTAHSRSPEGWIRTLRRTAIYRQASIRILYRHLSICQVPYSLDRQTEVAEP